MKHNNGWNLVAWDQIVAPKAFVESQFKNIHYFGHVLVA